MSFDPNKLIQEYEQGIAKYREDCRKKFYDKLKEVYGIEESDIKPISADGLKIRVCDKYVFRYYSTTDLYPVFCVVTECAFCGKEIESGSIQLYGHNPGAGLAFHLATYDRGFERHACEHPTDEWTKFYDSFKNLLITMIDEALAEIESR